MNTPTLEYAAGLVIQARELLAKDYPSLAAALEIVYAELDRQIDLEDERIQHHEA